MQPRFNRTIEKTEIRHQSKIAIRNISFINGCAGKLAIKSRLDEITPYLALGSEYPIAIRWYPLMNNGLFLVWSGII